MCLGYPAFFNTVEGGIDYQMILVQDVGGDNPNLLAFYDTDEAGGSVAPRPHRHARRPSGHLPRTGSRRCTNGVTTLDEVVRCQ